MSRAEPDRSGRAGKDAKATPRSRPRKAARGGAELAAIADDAGSGAANGIRAMLVGLNVLQSIGRRGQPIPLREVAAASGLTPSRVHRYLASLVELGFVEQDAATGYYSLGRAVVELGLLALGQIDMIRVGVDTLFTLGEATGLDGHLSVWGTHGPVIIRWRSGRKGNQIRVEEGRVLPILWTATGRVMIAYRDLADAIGLVAPERDAWNADHADHPITDADVERMCREVRGEGMSASVPFGRSLDETAKAADESLLEPLLRPTFWRSFQRALEAIAVPIFDHRGGVAMVLTMFGADLVSLTDPAGNYTGLLRDAAAGASRRLGFNG